MQTRSEINPMLTLDYITTADENKYFDRKSSQIKPSDLASHISAFANAEGGTIVIGVSDKTREIEGINELSQEKVNNFISAPKEYCKPMPICDTEFISVKNYRGKEDRILLLHIRPSGEQIIRTSNDSTYLRMGDRTKELKGEDYKSLEYNKSIRRYEDELNHNANIDDLDKELLAQYKNLIGAETLSDDQVLKARGMLVSVDNKEVLTNAAVLLFAKNIPQFYPNCRVRFLRYDGNYAGVGTDINIIKDVNIELPLTRIIDKADMK